MFTNNTYNKVILTVILSASLCAGCYEVRAVGTPAGIQATGEERASAPQPGGGAPALQPETATNGADSDSDSDAYADADSDADSDAYADAYADAWDSVHDVNPSADTNVDAADAGTTTQPVALLQPQGLPGALLDQQEREEITKIQEKIQIVQAPIKAPTYAVQYIAAIQSSLVSNIISTRMKVNPYDIRTSEDKNKLTAAGSQAVGLYITPQSWDIWANGHMGNIKQDAANATSANAQTDFYGGSIGIDKVFANNSVLGLALSYGQSNTEYTSKTSTGTAVNNKWASDYYQANIYTQHNFNNNLFLQLIGGIGTYGNGTTIGNMFDFTSQEFTFGYHGNATIGYSVFGGEDSNFAITPKLSAVYYHLNVPDSIIGKLGSSTFTTLDRVDGIAGLNIKIFSTSCCNVKIIPELTAAVKFRFYDNVDGINTDNIKLPVAQSTNPNYLSANALATPEQLFTLGGALTVTNNNFSISLHSSFDFAAQYLAAVGGISVKLSF